MGTDRTLIFEDDGIKWSYKVKWNDIFEPITNCKYKEDVAPWLPIKKFKNISTGNERHLFLDRRSPFEVNYQPEVQPEARSYSDKLLN